MIVATFTQAQNITLLNPRTARKGPSSQRDGFSRGHVWMWELDYKENWAPKNWCFWTMVLEKTLESPLDSKEIEPVNPKKKKKKKKSALNIH